MTILNEHEVESPVEKHETETEVLYPHEAEPVKYAEDVSILNFLIFDDYKDTEYGFKFLFDGFDDLEIMLMNQKNHTPEEIEEVKKLLLEKNEKLKMSRGRNIHNEFCDNEVFDNLDYTFEKMKIISKQDINEYINI